MDRKKSLALLIYEISKANDKTLVKIQNLFFKQTLTCDGKFTVTSLNGFSITEEGEK